MLKISFLALATAKTVSELHVLSYKVKHLRLDLLCFFSFVPEFQVNLQNPITLCLLFERFITLSQRDFVDGDMDHMLLSPVRVLKHYLSRAEQQHQHCNKLFISAGCRKMMIIRNTISFWIRAIINNAYKTVSEEDYRVVWVKAHEVQRIGSFTSLQKQLCSPASNVGRNGDAPDHIYHILP